MKKKTRIRYGELTPARPIAAVPMAPRAAVPAPKPAPRSLRERAAMRRGRADVLMFRVSHEHFAVDLGAVEEVIDLADVHYVPEMPQTMLGVIPVRGVLTALYTPRRALGLPLADGGTALVFRRGRSRVALSIDDVDDVLSLDLTTLRDPPDPASDHALVIGVARHRTGLIALLDADALLAASAAAPLQETA